MLNGAGGVRDAHPLFQEEGSGSTPTSALDLVIVRVPFSLALDLNKLWHSRLPRFGVGSVKTMPFPCWAAEFNGTYYGVGIWSNPVARLLPQQTWAELRRLAIAPDAPKNTASRMLRIMAMLLKRERPELVNLISYQDAEVHKGTIYAAAGWEKTNLSDGDEWDRPGRSRPKSQSSAPKQRWEKPV